MNDEIDHPFRLLRQVEAANNGHKPPPVDYGAWLAGEPPSDAPAPVGRPRGRRRRAQEPPEAPEPPTGPAFESEPGESYEAAVRRLVGDESRERFAARVAELAQLDQEPARSADLDQEPAKPERWWAPWLAWWRERH